MKVIAWIGLGLGLGSIIFSIIIVLSSADAMAQVRALEFPLTGLDEGVIAMLLPILLAAISGLAGIVSFRRKIGRVAILVAALSWLLLWAILGLPGFYHLF